MEGQIIQWQIEKEKSKNNDLQNTTQKTKNGKTQLNPTENRDCSGIVNSSCYTSFIIPVGTGDINKTCVINNINFMF